MVIQIWWDQFSLTGFLWHKLSFDYLFLLLIIIWCSLVKCLSSEDAQHSSLFFVVVPIKLQFYSQIMTTLWSYNILLLFDSYIILVFVDLLSCYYRILVISQLYDCVVTAIVVLLPYYHVITTSFSCYYKFILELSTLFLYCYNFSHIIKTFL